jgi:hypothetical protein
MKRGYRINIEQKGLNEEQRRLFRGQKRLDYEQERPCKE